LTKLEGALLLSNPNSYGISELPFFVMPGRTADEYGAGMASHWTDREIPAKQSKELVTMGKTVTPKWRLEVFDGKRWTEQAWSGRATTKRLEERVISIGKSYMPGGVNEHISKALGYVPLPVSARIVRNTGGNTFTKLEWRAPMFMVW
jgi:hypothetical protein